MRFFVYARMCTRTRHYYNIYSRRLEKRRQTAWLSQLSAFVVNFAQKHGADFVQNFFEKAIDIFAWRVYNGIVPGKTGAKKKTLQQMQQNGGTS